MSRCERCNARIPRGRNFCHPHYLEAIREYERELMRYQDMLLAWNRLSNDEKRLRDQDAEAIEVTAYTFFTALAMGGMVWYMLYRLYPIDGLIGIAIVAGVTVACINSVPLRTPVGRLTRALVKAVPGVASAAVFCLLLAMVSDWVAAYWTNIALVLGGLIVLSSLLMELLGKHRSTGEPPLPVEPRP